jgi:S-adenosylmethionine:diacylglycerol 3-amino-3-carboxypropyl transferase
MKHIYDFGVSQEDFKTEQAVLDIKQGDRILCVASGGELPLNLLCVNDNVSITAVDISVSQIYLSRLKMKAATDMEYPTNGYFLGYGKMRNEQRKHLYHTVVKSFLERDERDFWDENQKAIEEGVINAGRFELYMKKLRLLLTFAIGKQHLEDLINCRTVQEQEELFDKKIASRKAVQYLFKTAFHPLIYKKRGLSSKGLMHATANTGEKYFNGFRSFCTVSPASANFFLQYFLLGICNIPEALPEYLRETNRKVLRERAHQLNFHQTSVVNALQNGAKDTFNKVHLSNIGDWLSATEFKELLSVCKEKLNGNAKLCYRYLHKNQLDEIDDLAVTVEDCISLQEKDRFPFYSTLSITVNAQH